MINHDDYNPDWAFQMKIDCSVRVIRNPSNKGIEHVWTICFHMFPYSWCLRHVQKDVQSPWFSPESRNMSQYVPMYQQVASTKPLLFVLFSRAPCAGTSDSLCATGAFWNSPPGSRLHVGTSLEPPNTSRWPTDRTFGKTSWDCRDCPSQPYGEWDMILI